MSDPISPIISSSDPISVFTESDRKILQDVINQVRRGLLSTQGRPASREYYGEEVYAPEVYVAKIPNSGIPARSGPRLGVAICDIFQIVEMPSGMGTGTIGIDPQFVDAGFKVDVYNLSPNVIPGGAVNLSGFSPGFEYVPVFRDKFGAWIIWWDAANGDCIGGHPGGVTALVQSFYNVKSFVCNNPDGTCATITTINNQTLGNNYLKVEEVK